MGKAKFIQENGETILPITHEEAVLDNNGKNLPSKYQQKQDENLLTDSKTIVGAINELSNGNTTLSEELEAYDTWVQDIENITLTNQNKIGKTELVTTNKTLTGAINELFQNVDNGKNLIATSIGNPLITGDSTFNAMSEAILGLRRESIKETDARDVLYNMMLEDGYEANSSMTVDNLIELLDESNIRPGDIEQIACAYYYTFILKTDGSLWACGINNGQLGLGDTTLRITFTQVTTNINNDVKQIACGNQHAFILKNDGSIWSCGYNAHGQLGLGDFTTRTTFTQVTSINNVKQIACGGNHTFIIKNDGTVWACGYNSSGQLGLGDSNNRTTFTQVTTNINNDVSQIVCGGNQHTFILKNDGSVWSCGLNSYGQLGLGHTTQSYTFTQVTININNDVKQIACANNSTFILKNDGSVWSCGYNNYGTLGLNHDKNMNTFTQVTININNDVKQVSCGYNNTVILKNDGSVWGCGSNGDGQLGLADTTSRVTFTQATYNINNDVRQISCGAYHHFILKNDGTVWACGDNSRGELGLNSDSLTTFTDTRFSSSSPEYEISRQKLYYYLLDNSISVTKSMDIGTMLNLLVDGYISNMILGYENNLRIILTEEGASITEEDNMDSLISKVDEEFNANRNRLYELMSKSGYEVSSGMGMDEILDLLELSGIRVSAIKQIACGNQHTFVLKNDGSLWACGINNSGQLGLGDDTTRTTFTKVTTNINNDVRQVICGNTHTFIIKNDDSLWSCGDNYYGQLGLDDLSNRNIFNKVTYNINNVKQVICGGNHTFIIKNDGTVWACGYNRYGQLGLNDTNNRLIFAPITTNINNDVEQVICGTQHTFILKTDGSIWGCGYNSSGQLGLGDTDNRTTFTQVTTNINSDVRQVICGGYYTFIIKNDGTIWSCGSNGYGQLGLGATDTNLHMIFNQVTININNDVKQIACGIQHTFILKNDGSVWSCGANAYGQLGLDTSNTTSKTSFTQVTSINNDVKQIICGGYYTFIIKSDDSIWACGHNSNGQLGLSSTVNKISFTNVPRGL